MQLKVQGDRRYGFYRLAVQQAFMTRLLADYRVAMRTSTYAIFTPAQ